MTFAYGAGGLTLVADRGLHGLPPAAPALADIRVHVDAKPPWADAILPGYASPQADHHGVPSLRAGRAADGYALAYADGSSFWIDRGGAIIWMKIATTIEDACTYLAGPVLSFAFRLRGEFSLHASAVAMGDRALAFAGPHAAGKSTTAAALGRRGLAVLTDDILRLTQSGGEWRAHSFGSVLRLWPDGETLVFGTSGRLERLTPFWDKRAVAIGDGGMPAAPPSLPLAAVAFLSADDAAAAVTVRSIAPADALVRLAANSSAGYLLDGAARRVEFAQIASIAAAVPCVEATRPSGGASIDEWIDTVEDWMRRCCPRR